MDDETVRHIEQFGWSAVTIQDNDPPFLYSVGLLQSLHHPEFIVFGLEAPAHHALLSALVEQIRHGRSFAYDGEDSVQFDAGPLRLGFRRVHGTQHPLYLGYAMAFARELGVRLSAIQVFWPDLDGRFPFQPGCDEEVFRLQPRLDLPLTPSEQRRWNRQWECP